MTLFEQNMEEYGIKVLNIQSECRDRAFEELGFDLNLTIENLFLDKHRKICDFDIKVQKIPNEASAFTLDNPNQLNNLVKEMPINNRQTFVCRVCLSFELARTIFISDLLAKEFLTKLFKKLVKEYGYNGEEIVGPVVLTCKRPSGDVFRTLENQAGVEMRIYSDYYYVKDQK